MLEDDVDRDVSSRSALQARLRAALLHTLADEGGHLVLATGNKTELSLGAGVTHGDMVEGFAPLKDCPKTWLFELARHRATGGSPAVPNAVLEQRTTAQLDADGDLPPYHVLDAIVERYLTFGEGVEDLVRAGFDGELVIDLLRRIDAAEFERRQVPPGVRISAKAFGADRRMPITNGWRAHRRVDTGASAPERPRFGTDPETTSEPPPTSS